MWIHSTNFLITYIDENASKSMSPRRVTLY